MNMPWFHISNADEYVYHYTSAKTFTDYIFPSRSFRLSAMESLNDPKEATAYEFVPYYGPEEQPEFRELAEVKAVADSFIRKNVRIGCFCRDVVQAITTPVNFFHTQVHERGFARARMWAQYGKTESPGGHDGVCIVFDKRKLLQKFKTFSDDRQTGFLHSNVSYIVGQTFGGTYPHPAFMLDLTEMRRVGVLEYFCSHIQKHAALFYFQKNQDWSQEREWRCVFVSKPVEKMIVPIGDAIAGIVIGSEVSVAKEKEICGMAIAKEFPVAKMSWQNGSPNLRPFLAAPWHCFV
jgi:hypothetical protein